MSLLDALFRSSALRAIDHALAQSLCRLDLADGGRATPDAVLAGAALASLAVGRGHAGFDPAQPGRLLDGAIDWPSPHDWCDALAASRWVATPSDVAAVATNAPLVLEGGLLYLRRYREYERRLATGLQRIAAQAPATADLAALAPLFAALFPGARDGDRQARAAALALLRSLLLITGGPGTGKTTAIARLLLLLLARARDADEAAPRIALAAPTGRAAERMAESMRHAADTLRAVPGVDPALIDALPTQARTLHRLLGSVPDSPRFRFDADHPLPCDVVVVDEASMVDLPLMCKLVEAVPQGARLVLLGDRDQLPSVEAGDVLASIVDAAGAGDALPADAGLPLAPLLGAVESAGNDSNRSGLAGHRVQLQRGYRQVDAFQLGPLAAAVRDGDADAAIVLLRSGELAGVHFHEERLDPLAGGHRESLLAHWRTLADAPDAASALALAGRLRLLTALRDGPQGARGLNARIEEILAGHPRGGLDAGYFHGRLLLITENSYRHGLFNGDIGICRRDDAGALIAWFAGDRDCGGMRGFHPSTLPAHDSAYAMTVHKAQGSECDTVWLQLPGHDSRVLSRELLYTALTRARRELHVCASETVLRAALARHAARISGLAWRLR